ncbi:MAG: hypothetical protein HRU20_09290 [Pseudomonadales bacterium]|nr:hypothetical protein [Pseudomonadales bacterium]
MCSECGGKVKIIACIKDPLVTVPAPPAPPAPTALVQSLYVIDKILTHLDLLDDIIPPAFQLPQSAVPI